MVTISPISSSQNNKISFTGLPVKAPQRRISSAIDAIAQWEILKHPKFTEIIQEEEVATQAQILESKQIREYNYGFLDNLWRTSDKREFVEYFKRVTGFPNLKDVSQKILSEFKRVLGLANERLDYLRTHEYGSERLPRVLVSGYDEFCSVGLGHALPGSDLDKGYAIVRGVSGGLSEQKGFSDRIKGQIWENIDNRIMSINHTAAFPNIMTDSELAQHIHHVDSYAKHFVTPQNINFFRYQRLDNGNPISGSKFNIWLGDEIPTTKEKYDAKNLAYIVETIRDGKKIELSPYYEEPLFNLFENSEFCHCSNIIQSKPMQYKYDYSDIKKAKLKARQDVEKSFNSWSIDKQYELVKDIIRSMSGDSKSPEFQILFHSQPDKHRLLLNDILRGKVGCAIENLGNGREQTQLFFRDGEMAAKYADLNVYNTSY